jgi:tripartite-type tricarboxylate transporter receptor subunit TctC
MIAAAKQKPAEIASASAGVTTPGNRGMLLLQSVAGIKLLHVPYKGAGAANTAAEPSFAVERGLCPVV